MARCGDLDAMDAQELWGQPRVARPAKRWKAGPPEDPKASWASSSQLYVRGYTWLYHSIIHIYIHGSYYILYMSYIWSRPRARYTPRLPPGMVPTHLVY